MLATILLMTTREKIESLIDQVTALPDYAQAELVQSLLDIRAQQLGIYQLDDDDRVSLARSAEDIHHGRIVPDGEIEQMYARYGA